MILSRALLSFIGLLAGVSLILIFYYDRLVWRWGLAIALLLGILVYVFQPQINYFWLRYTGRSFSAKEGQIVALKCPYYARLQPEEKRAFGQECLYFIASKDIILQGVPSLPDDIQYVIAAQAISFQQMFSLPYTVFSSFERMVFYPHPFISPSIDHVHASESYMEDGVWIFSLEQFIPYFQRPDKFFNIVAYEFACTALAKAPEHFSMLTCIPKEEVWAEHLPAHAWEKEKIQQWINMPEINTYAVWLSYVISAGQHPFAERQL